MRVGLNATCFNDRPSGARQRFVGLYGEVINRCSDIEFVIYEPSDCRVAGWFGDASNVTAVRTPLPSGSGARRALLGALYWRGRARRDRLDLFECFNLPLPGGVPCPQILTVHDIRSTLRDRPLLRRTLAKLIHRRAMRGAADVITVSQTMRQQLLALEPRAQVVTIYNGIDPRWSKEPAGTSSGYGLPAQYILTVGHIEPRKNYGRLIEALARVRLKGRDIALVVVGHDGGGLAALRSTISALGLADVVHLLHQVDDANLRAIYDGALLVVFPSLYEGFGIPVLETMAARRPLLLSDIPVFRELTEGKGAYFPAHDAAAMADAIDAMLDNPQRQQELIAYGSKRLEDFRFDRLAKELESVYRRLAGSASGEAG